jgi:putative thioredoxin
MPNDKRQDGETVIRHSSFELRHSSFIRHSFVIRTMADSSTILDVTDATFQQDVIERSHEVPVVVDFWAPWCAPCRMLGPMLERAAREAAGKFVLAKIDIDRSPGLANAFGVSSIPLVVALRGGQIIDSFLGVLSQRELEEWLQRIQPSQAEQLESEAQGLEAGDPVAAEAKYRAALELAPTDAAAQIGLARALLAQGRLEESQKILDELASRGFLEAEAEALAADLALRRFAVELPDVEAVRRAAAAAPADPQRQLDLAKALAGAGEYEQALKAALEVVRRDRQGAGEAARRVMVHLFRRLGEEHDLTSEYRRKLSAALY